MRPAPASVTPPAPGTALHRVPPAPPPVNCDIVTCQWPPLFSGSFGYDAIRILFIFLCAIITAFVIHTVDLCCNYGCCRRGRPPAPHQRQHQQEQRQHQEEQQQEQQLDPKLAESDLIAAPAMTYTPGMAELAGTEAECAICLTEFVEGDGIRVLATCSHGFHVECIERWLPSHKSCPTCRSSLVVDLSESSEPEGLDHSRENADRRTDPAGESLSVGAASP